MASVKTSEFITSPSSMVLSDTDRALAERLLSQRKKIGSTYALIVGGAGLAFVVSQIISMLDCAPEDRFLYGLAIVAGIVVMVLMIDYFGFRLVRRMEEDLKAGLKHKRTAPLTHLEHHENAHGETISWIKLEGDKQKLLARGPIFAGYKEGERVTIEFLPRSRLVFSAKRADIF